MFLSRYNVAAAAAVCLSSAFLSVADVEAAESSPTLCSKLQTSFTHQNDDGNSVSQRKVKFVTDVFCNEGLVLELSVRDREEVLKHTASLTARSPQEPGQFFVEGSIGASQKSERDTIYTSTGGLFLSWQSGQWSGHFGPTFSYQTNPLGDDYKIGGLESFIQYDGENVDADTTFSWSKTAGEEAQNFTELELKFPFTRSGEFKPYGELNGTFYNIDDGDRFFYEASAGLGFKYDFTKIEVGPYLSGNTDKTAYGFGAQFTVSF